jgi:hypothetical protein
MAIPTLAEVRAYIGVPATSLSDADLGRIYAAQETEQSLRCEWPEPPADDPTADTYPDALGQAFLRRVQREVSAKNLPLGMVGVDAAEYGPQRLPFLDALVEENERPFRRQVLA